MNPSAPSPSPLFTGPFFENFRVLTRWQTLVWVALLLLAFWLLMRLKKSGKSFSLRMMIALGLGLALGLSLQLLEGMPQEANAALRETATWYGLFGRGFVALIRMLVIPLVFVSIVKVVLDHSGEKYLSRVAVRGIFWLLATTGIAALVGIALANLFGLGQGTVYQAGKAALREQTNLVSILVNQIPANIVSAMNGNNVVGLVIFSALLGIGAQRAAARFPVPVAAFRGFIDGLHAVVMSVTTMIIRLLPYGVTALMGGTLMSNGIPAILDVSGFIVAIYVAAVIMVAVHLLLVAANGLSPLTYLAKSREALVMAFSSRSSLGTLPMTIATLTERMGVSAGSANLVGSLGATMGMNGCAGFFPAMLVVMVGHMVGLELNLQFYLMTLIVVIVGSIGVAGIPGTATIAATIALAGMGLGEHFALIGMVLAVDPIVDMARTMTNVSGAMTSALITDKQVGSFDRQVYADPQARVSATGLELDAL